MDSAIEPPNATVRPAAGGAADVLIRGAHIHTVDDTLPRAEAVAIRDDRIMWVGSDDDARDLIGSGTEVIDAGGRLMLPGIIDSHNHVRLGSDDGAVQLAGAGSLDEIRARIAAWLGEHPDATWVEAEGFNYGAMPNGREPTADDLRGATGGLPAFVFTYDVHNVWLNHEAMQLFGITRDTRRLPFGIVHTDAAGEPTGFLGDFAVMGISREGQAALEGFLPGYAKDRQYERLLQSLDMAIGFGITTIVEPQNSVDDLPLYERARNEGRLRSRLVAALFHPPETSADELDEFQEARRRFDDDRLRVGPVKLYIDDVIESHSAALLDAYADRPGHTGETFYEPERFAETIVELERRGFQTFTHSTGDRGMRVALDAIEHARRVNRTRDARHQLVHVECVHPDDVARFGELGVVACMQPRHCSPDIVESWREAIGSERWPTCWPFRGLRDTGAVLAFSSDWNVAEMDPLVGIYTAQTRATLDGATSWIPDQTVDLATAIRAYTMGGAFANFCEHDRGSITPGKYADLVVLSRDLFELPPEAALDTSLELAMVGGEIHRRTF